MGGHSTQKPVVIFGGVGKSSTNTMIDAIFAQLGVDRLTTTVVVLSPAGEIEAETWRESLVALPETGIAALTADHHLVAAPAGTSASIVTFGLTGSADYAATDVDASLSGTRFTLRHLDGNHDVALQILGEHQVINACAALAVAHASGIPLERAIDVLNGLASAGAATMERYDLADGTIIINDAVSASPESTAAALKSLALVAGGRRTVAVLGELTTADDDHRESHDRIGRLIVRLNVTKLFVVGHRARHIHNAAGLEGSWDGESVLVDSIDEAYDRMREELQAGDVVLVKSSKQAGLDALASRLLEAER